MNQQLCKTQLLRAVGTVSVKLSVRITTPAMQQALLTERTLPVTVAPKDYIAAASLLPTEVINKYGVQV